MFVTIIEGTAYGPFTEEEAGEFNIDYEATFEFVPKPERKTYQLVKIKGGEAAEIHVPPAMRV